MMTTNLFVIANVKRMQTDGSLRVLVPFFRTSWGVAVLNSAIFNNFYNRVWYDFEGPSEFRERGLNTPTPTPRHATGFNNVASPLSAIAFCLSVRKYIVWCFTALCGTNLKVVSLYM